MELPKISENLKQRIISAGILAPVVLFILWMGGSLFSSLVVFMAVIMSMEWHGIINANNDKTKEMDSKVIQKWRNYGIAYVGVFASSMIYVRSISGSDGQDSGFGITLLMLLLVWATDIAAYFAGRAIGGPKIYTKISPNKTWAGLGGGMLAAGLIGVVASVFIDGSDSVVMFMLGALMAILAQAGDFLESWIKRKFGVKDSGDIIPGHGGVMDRMDGFVTVAPVFAIILLLSGGSFFK